MNSLEQKLKDHNKEMEQKEIEWLKTAPSHVLLYVSFNSPKPALTTWLGTGPLSDTGSLSISARKYVGFGRDSYRRSVTCKIFGTLYHGWYMESSGEYCRLRKAAKQGDL